GGAGGMGGAGGSAPTVQLTVEVEGGLSGTDLANISVCINNDPTSCQTTAANGQATLTVPDTDVTLEYSGAGYRKHIITQRQGGSGFLRTVALSDVEVATLLQAIGRADTGPHVIGTVNVAGATVSLNPAPTETIIYSGSNQFPDPTLTTTSAGGGFIYTNVMTAMQQELEVTHPTLTCTPTIGPMGTASNRTPLTIEPGAITVSSAFTCQ
ncbi:MAG: hypothetical protein AAF928_13170, partial [Myxococcota bacterium]